MKPYEPFRYATEAGLHFRLDRFVMCQQDEFKKFEKSPDHFPYLENCNLYFICRRNRIGILPNTIKATDETVYLTFQCWEGDNKFDFPICFKNNYGTTKLTIVSKSPHDFFSILDENGKVVYEAKSSYVADDHRANIFPNPDFLDFEILYIGCALDKSVKPTFNRLIKHKTLQKIYSENTPDKEVFLFLFPLFISGDIEIRGTARTQKEYEAADSKRLENFLSTGLKMTHEQQVAVAEAALIKYFQPKYNSHHTKTFPTKRNPSYDELYKMDFNTVTIEVDTTEIALDTRFYSEKVKTNPTHLHSFFLPTETDRRRLFDYSVGFDTDTQIV